MSEYPEFKKTIMIGLGGAGKMILTHMKRLLMDTYDIVPPSIKFMSLDTDSAPTVLRSIYNNKEYRLDDSELLYLRLDQPVEYIEECEKTKPRWFIRPLPMGAITNGAGAIREVGRLAFLHNLNAFKKALDKQISALNDPRLPMLMENAVAELKSMTNFRLVTKDDPDIYICGSLAGGTGSGTFIDVGVMVRDQINNAAIHGYFLLNWVYRNKTFAYRVPGNVYAAMTELDYLQSISFKADTSPPYEFDYHKSIKVNTPPYTLVHLFDGRNEAGENIDDVGELCTIAATAVFLSITSMGDKVNSVTDNLKTHINVNQPKVWHGKQARYTSFGVSSIYYPARELHRLIAAENAMLLCEAARDEVEQNTSDPGRLKLREQQTGDQVDRFIGEQNLNLMNSDFVKEKVCPFKSPNLFPITDIHIADKMFPLIIDEQVKSQKQQLEQQLEGKWKTSGQQFAEETLRSFRLKIAEIKEDAQNDAAYLRSWLSLAIARVTTRRDAAKAAVNKQTKIANERQSAMDRFRDQATQVRYNPFIKGARKKAVEAWSAAIVDSLNAMKALRQSEYENRFFDQILGQLRAVMPEHTERSSETVSNLQKAIEGLRKQFLDAENTITALKAVSNQVLLGSGNTVVLPATENNIALVDALRLSYDQFKSSQGINNINNLVSRKSPAELISLFTGYSTEQWNAIKQVSLMEAIETLGKESGRPEDYIKEKIDHLFRLASALWSFTRSRLNMANDLYYDHIINLGVCDTENHRNKLDQAIMAVKANYNIRSDHSFSETGEPHRIWLLNHAAALPAYFITNMEENRESYEKEITPTYHLDSFMEMNAPDLFPADDIFSKALRAIGMAIVPGIDVIQDEKLVKGHKFTFSDPDYVLRINLGQPKTWGFFKEMLDEVVNEYDPKAKDNLYDFIKSGLVAKVSSMSQEDLRQNIETHLKKVKQKMEGRDFSKLYSARLTYQEIMELEAFLEPQAYGMDINRYLEGDRIR